LSQEYYLVHSWEFRKKTCRKPLNRERWNEPVKNGVINRLQMKQCKQGDCIEAWSDWKLFFRFRRFVLLRARERELEASALPRACAHAVAASCQVGTILSSLCFFIHSHFVKLLLKNIVKLNLAFNFNSNMRSCCIVFWF
jgi:hypothetical protein